MDECLYWRKDRRGRVGTLAILTPEQAIASLMREVGVLRGRYRSMCRFAAVLMVGLVVAILVAIAGWCQ